MNIDWSFHAQDQLADILRTIAYKQSYDDAVRWRLKINDDLGQVAYRRFYCPVLLNIRRVGLPVRSI